METNEYIASAHIVKQGVIEVTRRITTIADDGAIDTVDTTYSISPGQDYSGEDESVRSLCQSVHTDEIVASYQVWVNNQ
jgi:hypothetical protein